jgi:hypothetical protein
VLLIIASKSALQRYSKTQFNERRIVPLQKIKSVRCNCSRGRQEIPPHAGERRFGTPRSATNRKLRQTHKTAVKVD